jgi:hypothetical protein
MRFSGPLEIAGEEIGEYKMKLPACVEEYINLIIKKMRYRRKVHRDVQEELAAHFEDELKDCKTDEEKQQKAERLITEFGDMKLLAILLRRAKKRCRPLWRTIVARTFQTVGVLIICFIFYMIWFLTGKPVITTNYVAELNKVVQPAADESLNAAPLYLRAVELQKELSDDFILFIAKNHQKGVNEALSYRIETLTGRIEKVFSDKSQKDFQQKRQDIQDEASKVIVVLLGKKYDELFIEQKNLLKRWIQEQHDALELIVEGSRKPYYWRIYKSGGRNPNVMLGVLLPNLSDFRNLARTLRLRADLHAEQGEYEEAFDDLKSCYSFGRHLKGDKFLIEQLTGIALEAISVRTIRDILAKYEIDSKLLMDLQHSFEQIIENEKFTISLEAEKLFIYDEIQRCFTDGHFGGGHLYLSRMISLSGDYHNDLAFEEIISPRQWPRAVNVLFTHPDKQQTREMADRFYDFWTTLSHKTLAQIKADGINPEKEASKIIEGNVFLQILEPALTRINHIACRNKTDVRATVAVLAVKRFEKEKGRCPASMEELVKAGYLKKLPVDPFSDGPFVYKMTDSGFILYSLGENLKDDGGKLGLTKRGKPRMWADNGDWVFWPLANPQDLK